MPRFIHVDHSLCRVGGHEYEYALNIAGAAEAAGYEIVVATSRRFRRRSAFPPDWQQFSVFPWSAWNPAARTRPGPLPADHALPESAWGAAALPAPGQRSAIGRVRQRLLQLRQVVRDRRQVSAFAGACRQLFGEIGFADGDQVFFATFADADLPGLIDFITAEPAATVPTWHLLFHFEARSDSPAGRWGDRLWESCLCDRLSTALGRLNRHRVCYYSTTAALAKHYRALTGVEFQYLPFAVNPTLDNCATDRPADRLRLTCAGGMRREKGSRRFRTVVQAIREHPELRDSTELVAQLGRRGLGSLRLSKLGDSDDATPRIVPIPHPLTTGEYHELLQSTDVALFLYDPVRYRNRCSGVLQEMLVAGHPVIVPAASWLAEQIAEPNYRHVETLLEELPRVERQCMQDLVWQHEDGPVPVPFRTGRHLSLAAGQVVSTCLNVPQGADELVLHVGWAARVDPQIALVECRQYDTSNQRHRSEAFQVGQRRADQNVPVLVHLAAGTRHVELRLRSAATSGRIALAGLAFDFLRSSHRQGCPAGKIGLAYVRLRQIPLLVHDIRQHFRHYVDSVRQHGGTLRTALLPSRTIQTLREQSRRVEQLARRRVA